jgi:predicted kinase
VEYAKELPPAILVITCGLPATGKSTLAKGVAARGGFEVLSSDIVRKELAGVEPGEHRYEEFRRGIYTSEVTRQTYEALFERARELLEAGKPVVLDASFLRRDQRRAARRLAADAGAQFACLYLPIEDDEARRRITRRVKAGTDPSDARWQTYTAQKRRFQKPVEVPPDRLITIDSSGSAATRTASALRLLRAISPLSFGGGG